MTVILTACAADSAQQSQEQPQVAAAPAPTPDPREVEAEIIQLERDWVAAILKKDVDTLNRLLSDDFVGTAPSGGNFSKTQAIEDLKSGAYSIQSMEMDEVSANIYGNTAVAFTSQEEKSTYAGKNNSGHYHFTNVWIKRDGNWQVVASHGSPYRK
jgi:ketosteroid isomerase-like protein